MHDLSSDLRFLYELGALRYFPRAWVSLAGPGVQNNAEHTFRVIWLALLIAQHERAVDTGKIVKLALVHDLGEIRSGDLNAVSRMYADRDEERAVRDTFYGVCLADEYTALWTEYETLATPESRIVKDADWIEADLEAVELIDRGCTVLRELRIQKLASGFRDRLHTETGRRIWDSIAEGQSGRWFWDGPNRLNTGDWKKSPQG